MKLQEIKYYLEGNCVVRNYKFEYKKFGDIYYWRSIGKIDWFILGDKFEESIDENEFDIDDWEIVSF